MWSILGREVCTCDGGFGERERLGEVGDLGEVEVEGAVEERVRSQVLVIGSQVPAVMMVDWWMVRMLDLAWVWSFLWYWGVMEPPFRALQIISKRSVFLHACIST